jgi:hypothetical protein
MDNLFYRILRQQLQGVSELIQSEEPFLYVLLEPAYSMIYSALLTNNKSEKRLIEIKETLHLLDSIITNMDSHVHDEVVDHLKYWAYLYSLYDKLVEDFENRYAQDIQEINNDNWDTEQDPIDKI